MSDIIPDTNALWVADKKFPKASAECIQTCVELLESVYKTKVNRVVVDWSRKILLEYITKLQEQRGQPGVGSAFAQWVRNNWGNVELIEFVTIMPQGDTYAEFPPDPDLAGFDKSDHKFVAVALKYERERGVKPTIYNATDTDWRNFYTPLTRYVQIQFLCPDMVAQPLTLR